MRKLIPYIGMAIVVSLLFGVLYGIVQQAQRSDANYPQIQMAEDTATALNHGAQVASLTTGTVAMETSLAPFIIIYNTSGKVVAGTGYLQGAIPTIPIGILMAATGKQYHAVTWQPQANLRVAAVSVAAGSYYVVAGRSLTEVERNERTTFLFAVVGWVASLVVIGGTYTFQKCIRS